MTPLRTPPLCAAATAATLTLLALTLTPSTARAELVHLTGLAGGTYVLPPAGQHTSPTSGAYGLARIEGTVALLGPLHLGAYGEGLTDLRAHGAGAGGLLALRLRVPFTPVGLMGFASLGYASYPTMNESHTGALVGEAGGTVSIELNRWVDFDLRGAYVRNILRASDALGVDGATGAAGFSLRF